MCWKQTTVGKPQGRDKDDDDAHDDAYNYDACDDGAYDDDAYDDNDKVYDDDGWQFWYEVNWQISSSFKPMIIVQGEGEAGNTGGRLNSGSYGLYWKFCHAIVLFKVGHMLCNLRFLNPLENYCKTWPITLSSYCQRD